MSIFTPTSRYVNCVCTPSEAVVIAVPAEYEPVATGIFDPIFSVACCPSVARIRGFCNTRVSESDSSAFTVPPVIDTAKFVAFRLPSVFSVIPEVGVVVVAPLFVVVPVESSDSALLAAASAQSSSAA